MEELFSWGWVALILVALPEGSCRSPLKYAYKMTVYVEFYITTCICYLFAQVKVGISLGNNLQYMYNAMLCPDLCVLHAYYVLVLYVSVLR